MRQGILDLENTATITHVGINNQRTKDQTKPKGKNNRGGHLGIVGAIDSAVASLHDSISSMGRSFHFLHAYDGNDNSLE